MKAVSLRPAILIRYPGEMCSFPVDQVLESEVWRRLDRFLGSEFEQL